MILAGFPATTVPGGTSLVTTEPAPTTEPSPTVTPGTMVTLAQSQTSFPMRIGAPLTFLSLLSSGSMGCTAATMWQSGPIIVLSPTEISAVSRNVQL